MGWVLGVARRAGKMGMGGEGLLFIGMHAGVFKW